ncbi:FAR1 DNA-binding domain protein [Medicago truncatula]|uniref:FAR1 DNA-binding domain protein n=1 Tax=Medicago truncatula TaxID=3880 RepID=A0A072VTM2_MEDTR|nr:FAR1 DNA-binding domain protein [Medicago truncatula]
MAVESKEIMERDDTNSLLWFTPQPGFTSGPLALPRDFSTITGCTTRMVISLDRKIGKYKVVDFEAQHNHLLVPPEYVHMIRSHRHISEAQASKIVLGDNLA